MNYKLIGTFFLIIVIISNITIVRAGNDESVLNYLIGLVEGDLNTWRIMNEVAQHPDAQAMQHVGGVSDMLSRIQKLDHLTAKLKDIQSGIKKWTDLTKEELGYLQELVKNRSEALRLLRRYSTEADELTDSIRLLGVVAREAEGAAKTAVKQVGASSFLGKIGGGLQRIPKTLNEVIRDLEHAHEALARGESSEQTKRAIEYLEEKMKEFGRLQGENEVMIQRRIQEAAIKGKQSAEFAKTHAAYMAKEALAKENFLKANVNKRPPGVSLAEWEKYLENKFGHFSKESIMDVGEVLAQNKKVEDALRAAGTKLEGLDDLAKAFGPAVAPVAQKASKFGAVFKWFGRFGRWGGGALGTYGTYQSMKDFQEATFEPQNTGGSSIIIPPKFKQADPRPVLDVIGIPSRYRVNNKDRLQYFDPRNRDWVGISRPLTSREEQERQRLIKEKQ